MSQSANVRSVDALKDFKIALINYAEEARVALSSTEMDLTHARNWLERDQLSYWKTQVKRQQEALAMAKSELYRRQLSQQGSDAVSDADQKEAVRESKRKLAYAEDKVETVKRWVPIMQHATSEYHSQSQPLGDRLSGGFLNTLAALERMISALEDYLTLAAPTIATPHGPGSSTAEATSTATSGAAAPVTSPAAEPTPAPTSAPSAGTEETAPAEEHAGAESGSDVR